jgi:hypothetical protein
MPGVPPHVWDFWFTLSALVSMPAILILTALTIRREWRVTSGFAITLLVVQVICVAVYCWKLDVYFVWSKQAFPAPTQPSVESNFIRMFVYAAFSLLCLIGTISMAVLCCLNFGNGLNVYLKRSFIPDDSASEEHSRRRSTIDSMDSRLLPRKMELD